MTQIKMTNDEVSELFTQVELDQIKQRKRVLACIAIIIPVTFLYFYGIFGAIDYINDNVSKTIEVLYGIQK